MSAGMASMPHGIAPLATNQHTLAGQADGRALLDDIVSLGERLRAVRAAIGRLIFGQQEVVDQALITLLSGGHMLLVGVPGLGKSRLVETLGVVLGLATKRVQFTPDLMPADILGSEVLDEAEGRRGVPVPARPGVLPAPDGGRDQPRQPAHAIGPCCRRCRSSGSRSRASSTSCPSPSTSSRTQNPIEQEGTYPLPEAQLDRFLLEIAVGYPDLAAERTMLLVTTGSTDARPVQAMTFAGFRRRAGIDPPGAGGRERGRGNPGPRPGRPARDVGGRVRAQYPSPGDRGRGRRRR